MNHHKDLKASPAFLTSFNKPLRMLAIIPSLGFIASVNIMAQDFEKIAPKPMYSDKQQRQKLLESDEPLKESASTSTEHSQSPSEEVELTANLKGLVFVPKTTDIDPNGRPKVRGIRVERIPLMEEDDWYKRFEHLLGNRFTMADLNNVLQQVVVYYRAAGRPVVDVVVVEQDITSGVIQLAVVEAVLGEVKVEGARFFSTEFLEGQVRLIPGEVINSLTLANDLNWLNQSPFRTVDMVYTPGKEVGQSDVILRVHDRRPWRVYMGYEDSGNELTGDNRWSMGFNYGNLWGLDHQVNYQWTLADDVDHLNAHSLSYVVPLPWRHTLTLFGAYVESSAPLPEPLDLDGHSGQFGLRYKIPLRPVAKWRGMSYKHELEFGYDYKNSTNNLEFNKIPVLGVNTDIHQLMVSYRGQLRDKTGLTSFGTSLYYSPGGIGGGNNDDEAYEFSRAGADSSYMYGQFFAERLQKLPQDFTGMFKVLAQWSDGNLLPSEQLGVGGYNTVRGYEENESTLDQGLLMTLELRAPSFEILPIMRGPKIKDEAQFLVFWDYALGGNVDRLPGEHHSVHLSSVGAGFRWSVGANFSLRMDYGFQLLDTPQNLGAENSRLHIGATLGY